jgi:hypothetical protein
LHLETLENRCLLTTVTNLSDHDPGSLRDAIATTPPGGTVDFQPGLSGTIILTTGDVGIAKDLTITGPGASVITVSGNHSSRVLSIAAPFHVVLSGLSIAEGMPAGGGSLGGGVFNAGTLEVADSTIRDNSVSGFLSAGGGIYNSGTLTVTNSTLSGNSAGGNGGGGIYNSGGTLTLTNSTLSGNSASNSGGGIYNSATATITNSTLSGNSADFGSGGGIYNAFATTLTLTSCTLSGNRGGGIYNVATATITNSTLSGNSGGGIYNFGTLTVTNSTFSGNFVTGGGSGGGIYNSGGTVTVTNSTFSGNFVTGGGSGGGIDNAFGPLTVTSSTFTGNSAGSGGGGILNFGTLTVTNSTLSGNSASNIGGGIYNSATATITGSTLSGNSASDNGGGIYNSGNMLTVTSCTLSGNSAGGSGGGIYTARPVVAITRSRNAVLARNAASSSPDVAGLLFSRGHNLIGDGTGARGFHDTDLVGTPDFPIDPQLEPLGDYGGPTQTMRPLPSSPVINAGDNTDAPETDQRGFPRIVLDFIDIGAVELQPDEFGPRSRETLLIAFGRPRAGSWGSVVEAPVSPVARQEVTEPLQHVDATVRRAKDLVFGESHRTQRLVPASEWEGEVSFV